MSSNRKPALHLRTHSIRNLTANELRVAVAGACTGCSNACSCRPENQK